MLVFIIINYILDLFEFSTNVHFPFHAPIEDLPLHLLVMFP